MYLKARTRPHYYDKRVPQLPGENFATRGQCGQGRRNRRMVQKFGLRMNEFLERILQEGVLDLG